MAFFNQDLSLYSAKARHGIVRRTIVMMIFFMGLLFRIEVKA